MGNEWIEYATDLLLSRGWTRCYENRPDLAKKDNSHCMHPPEEFEPPYLHYDIWEAYKVEMERSKPKQKSLF